jgi:hypothetical protein
MSSFFDPFIDLIMEDFRKPDNWYDWPLLILMWIGLILIWKYWIL